MSNRDEVSREYRKNSKAAYAAGWGRAGQMWNNARLLHEGGKPHIALQMVEEAHKLEKEKR